MKSDYGALHNSGDAVPANSVYTAETIEPTERMPLLASHGSSIQEGEAEDISCYQKYCPGITQSCNDVREFCGEVGEMCASIDCKGCLQSTCTCQNFLNKFPFLKWLPKYRCPEFQGDLIAGLTVGLTVIPQGLAYAVVAGLPPQYGLYSAFMGCFVYMFFGTSKDITLGPTAIMSLMTAAFGESPYAGDATLAIVLTLLSGAIQLLMGVFRLGFLVNFIPYPVINSFTCAAAITIAFGQVKKWLGLHDIPSEFLHQLYETFHKIPETNIYDFALGLISMIILYIMKRMKNIQWSNTDVHMCVTGWRKVIWLIGTARNAIIVILAAGIAAAMSSHGHEPFSLTGNITGGLPDFEFPAFYVNETINDVHVEWTPLEIFKSLGAGIIIVPLMGVVESIAIGNAFARKNNYVIDPNQELIAIGAANIAGSFVSSYPVTGSFSRTAVNSQSGVKTPAGGVFTGALVLVALALLTPWFYFIPNAALAGVIIMAVLDMVSFQLLRRLWRVKRIDILPWMVTFIFSFLTGIEYGIIAGILCSLLMLLYPWASPGVVVVKGQDQDVESASNVMYQDVIVVELSQGIRFPGIDYVREKVYTAATAGDVPRSVVFDVQHMSNIDYSVVQGLTQMNEDFELKGIILVFAGLQPEILDTLTRANLANFHHAPTVEEARRMILDAEASGELHEGVLPQVVVKSEVPGLSPAEVARLTAETAPLATASETDSIRASTDEKLEPEPVDV